MLAENTKHIEVPDTEGVFHATPRQERLGAGLTSILWVVDSITTDSEVDRIPCFHSPGPIQ
jgi:hypothetical protein